MNLPTIILFTVTAVIVISTITFMKAFIHAVAEEILPAVEKAAGKGEYPQVSTLKMEKTRNIF
ncbi:MAG: hypothetical protein HFJ26_01130 [Clostridia bacterium]|nr:hypothetical protein [Clostridia bacterium]